MVTRLFPSPPELVATIAHRNAEGEVIEVSEIPIIALALHDTGEITGVAWSQKQKRIADDVSDEIFFPGFASIEMSYDEDEDDAEDIEPPEDLE